MNYLGPFHSRKSRATPFRMTMTAFQSPLRIIFYRSLLSRTCSNSSFRFCLVTPTAVLQGLLHTTAETHQISTTENSCQATSMRVRNLSMTHEVYTTGLCFLCCLVNCYVFAAPLPLFLPLFASGLDTRSRKRCSNNMASTSKRVARKDTNSIRSHQHLCAVMLLSGCLAVCGYLCRRLCVTVSLLQGGFPWTVCLGCVTQRYKQHQCILQAFLVDVAL